MGVDYLSIFLTNNQATINFLGQPGKSNSVICVYLCFYFEGFDLHSNSSNIFLVTKALSICQLVTNETTKLI